MNKILSVFYIFSLFVFLVFGIYEEEIGKRDWSIRNIGQYENSLYFPYDDTILVHSKLLNKIENIEDTSSSTTSTTTSHVISLLDSSSGNQRWRQLLPLQEHTFQTLTFNSFDNDYFLTLTNNKMIRYWNRNNGELLWSYDTSLVVEGNCNVADIMSKDGIIRILCDQAILFIKREKQVIVLSNINSNNNDYDYSELRSLNLENVYSISKKDGGKEINFIEFDKNFKISTIKKQKLSNPIQSNQLKINENHIFNRQILVILTTPSNLDIINFNNNKNNNNENSPKIFNTNLNKILIENKQNLEIQSISSISNNNQFIIILSNGDHLLVEFNIENNTLEIIKSIKRTNIIKTSSSSTSNMMRGDKSSSPSSMSLSIYLISGNEIVVDNENKNEGEYFIEVVNGGLIGSEKLSTISKKSNGLIERVDSFNGYILISMSDWSIHMFKLNGAVLESLWSREEALSFILSTEIIDYPLPDISKLAQLQYEFNETDGFFTHFSKRITTQLGEIFGLNKQQQKQQQQLKDIAENEQIKKIIIVTTKSGKVFGLNSKDGKVLWSIFYLNFNGESNVMRVYITKKTVYESPEVAIIFPLNEKPKSLISFINPLDGKERNFRIINHKLLHTNVLSQWSDPVSHAQMMYWVINYPLDHPSPMVTLYPWNEQTRKQWSRLKQNYFYLVDVDQSQIKGYGIESLADGKHGGIKSIPTWNIKFGGTTKIIGTGSMNVHEVIQSPAIIMGNRDLLPKYINRNMISIATLDDQSVLTITLIDSITGEIIKSFKHQHASNKISLVQTENSVVYSHFDTMSQTQLISSIDIFERNIDWNTETVSSFNSTTATSSGQLSDQLIIKQKSFVFTHGLIKTLSLSITDKGITSKHILVGFANGQILPIDKKFINARRPYPNEVTPNDAEEQLIPYKPMLQFPPWFFTTYNSTVFGLTTITSTGTDLESTSLVFAYGQPDVFCILITPSLPYDILSDQFNHISLIVTSVTLLILAFIAKNYKNSLLLSKKWK
ncbi:hypothetical protein RB653_002625 [Dictyostelium firmibasis]|uniref:ER membrane protein complex subunit 1 n=1 Tax=Dictyostelium firmibasis TaxID=79012 RepID=A0AAN7YQ93_9MYCE